MLHGTCFVKININNNNNNNKYKKKMQYNPLFTHANFRSNVILVRAKKMVAIKFNLTNTSNKIFYKNCIYSGASEARRAAKRSTITIGTEPYACVETETHATDFSWSTWLTAWIAGACAQRRRRRCRTY